MYLHVQAPGLILSRKAVSTHHDTLSCFTQEKAGCGGANCNNSTQEADTRTTVLSLRLALAYTVQSKAAEVRHNTVSKKKKNT